MENSEREDVVSHYCSHGPLHCRQGEILGEVRVSGEFVKPRRDYSSDVVVVYVVVHRIDISGYKMGIQGEVVNSSEFIDILLCVLGIGQDE